MIALRLPGDEGYAVGAAAAVGVRSSIRARDVREAGRQGYVGGMASMLDRLRGALNSRDAAQMAALFAKDYESVQPLHPSRGFGGRDQVFSNWSAVFAGVPDFTAELVLSAMTDDGVEVGEWRWRGTHEDGSPFAMEGVIVVGLRGDQIAWGRLYMEPVEQGGSDIDEMVQETYRPRSQ